VPQKISLRDPFLQNTGKTILVVEDEVDLLDVIGQVLSGAGYRVIVAHTAAEAVLICGHMEESIDIILSDFNLPGGNGSRLAKSVGAIRPNLPVVFMTGNYTAFDRLTSLGFTVLQKPFSFADMEYTVGKTLADSALSHSFEIDKSEAS